MKRLIAVCALLVVPPLFAQEPQPKFTLPHQRTTATLIYVYAGLGEPKQKGFTDPDEAERLESVSDLRTRLYTRLDPKIAKLAGAAALADVIIQVTKREIVGGTNTVYVKLTCGDFSSELTGTDDGMWGQPQRT